MFDNARGIYCTLRRPNVNDVKTMVRWLEDPYLATTVFDQGSFEGGNAKKQVHEWIQANSNVYGSDSLTLITEAIKENEPIGMVIFSNIDWRSRTAELRYLIGEEKYRSNLYGPETVLLSLQHAFNTLNFHKLYGNVSDSNRDSLEIVKFGGRTEGKLEGYLQDDETSHDYWLFGLFADDFRKFIEENREGMLRRHIRAGLIA